MMKRIPNKRNHVSRQDRKIESKPVHRTASGFIFLFTLILLTVIGMRVYKAVHTGIIYDEVFTVWNFGQRFHDAMTSYKNPNNNHILNSILINVDRVLFSGQEYFFRFHSIVFGAIYCCSMAYLVQKLIGSRVLRIGLLLLLTGQWFVFDLTVLARGYSIALAAVFGGLALLVFLLRRKLSLRHVWIPVCVLTVMNFFAMGSMLSVIVLLVVINACYILFFSYRVFEKINAWTSILIHLIGVTAGTTVSLYLLYQYIYKDILAARTNFGKMPLMHFLKEVLWSNIIGPDLGRMQWVYGLFLLLTAAALIYAGYVVLKSRQRRSVGYLNMNDPRAFIVLTALLFFAGMYVYRNLANMSLGYPRNGVFLIPLFLLSCGILLDAGCACVREGRFRTVTAGLVCLVMMVLAIATRPSLYAVQVYTWEIQSIARPLIRDLKKIDPNRRWKILLTQNTWHMNLPLQYYQLTGQPVRMADIRDYDVIIAHRSEEVGLENWFRESFYDAFECKVGFNPAIERRYRLTTNSK